MRLHLIRHGQTDWNATRRIQGQAESHLDATGQRQAQALGERLAAVPFVRAYVSSAQRTRQTAERLLAGRDLPVHFRDDLREMRLGRWESLMWDEVEANDAEQAALYRAFDERFAIRGAETLSQMQQRGVEALRDIVRRERRADAADDAVGAPQIAVVSHGFLLRAILADLLDRPLQRFAGLPALPNCAHSVLEVPREGRPRVLTIDSLAPESGLWASLFTGGQPADRPARTGDVP